MSIGGIKENIDMKIAFKKMGLKSYPVIVFQKDGDDEMIFPKFCALERLLNHLNSSAFVDYQMEKFGKNYNTKSVEEKEENE
jgi:hypothetical protein